MKNTMTIGITGGIGSGKSFICSILGTMGYPVFHSDQVAKDLMATNHDLIKGVKSIFLIIKSEISESFKFTLDDPNVLTNNPTGSETPIA